MRTLIPLTAIACLASPGAMAAVFPVGTGLGCGYATVQAAVDHAATYPGDDVIRISRTLTYTAQAIVVGNQTVEIVGGFDDCLDSVASGTTTLGGAGGATDSVMRIESHGRVVLRHLTLSGGDESDDGFGGGIEFRGNGVLEIADSSISNNRAGYGGGIHAVGTGREAELILGANVLVSNNVAAQRGGGLFVESLEMTMTAPGSLVAFNRAVSGTGDGGGLLLRGAQHPVFAYIGSPGYSSLGTFYANEAKLGGAIALVSGDDSGEHSTLFLFATDAAQPPALRGNSAQVAGGALYLRPDGEDSAALTDLQMAHAVIDGNVAPDGAAIFLGHESFLGDQVVSAYATMETGLIHPAAVHCTQPVACNRVVNNRAGVPAGPDTDGAIVRLGPGSHITGARAEFAGNRGGRVLHASGTPERAAVLFDDSVFAGNACAHEVMRLETNPGALLRLKRSTIGGNTVGATHVLFANGTIEIHEVLIGQPGRTALASNWQMRLVERSMSTDNSLGGPASALVAAPRFVDPERGDVRLRAASLAVDNLTAVAGDDRDVVGARRDQPLPYKIGVDGPRDIGAHERPVLLPLVLNGAFAADLRLWTGPNTTWDGTQDANLSSASGAALLRLDDPAQPRVTGASHCVHLPGPGRYRLSGSGKAVSSRHDHRDPVALNWQLRSDGGEACNSGLPLRQGDLVLAQTNEWNRPAPALIDINAAEWTRNSSIAVTLVVTDTATLFNRGVVGWFDDIVLDVVAIQASALPFDDGFEN